jgi:hypothetical protein
VTTSEQRLDRLERIAKLFVSAGLRARRNMKDPEEKINTILNSQREHDERFAGLNQSFERSQRELNQSIERSHSELSQPLNELAQVQTHTNQRLNSLIGIVERDRNGNSH